MISRRNLLKGLLGVSLAGLFAGVYGAVIEPGWRLRVQRWAVRPAVWPRGRKLRIVMVADIHAGVPHMSEARVQEIVDRANELGGDLIVLMGDYRASHRFQTRMVPIEAIAPILAGLQAPLGVHAILGNHDWWDDPEAMARKAGPTHSQRVLEAAGISVLENRALRLGQGADAVWLAGTGSMAAFHVGRGGRHKGMDDLPATLAQVTDDAPVVLLAHEPDLFPQVPERVAVTLSGHTHGGQIRFAGWAPFVPSAFGMRYAYGHVTEGGRDLVVSGGLGCSGLPIRFGMPPELTVVDLS